MRAPDGSEAGTKLVHSARPARGMDVQPPPMPAELDVYRASRGQRRARRRGVGKLAGRQHGVIARCQLLALGFSDDSIDRQIGWGDLHMVHRSVYAVGHPRLTLRGRWMAAVLSCGSGALLSHRSAAALWGILPRLGAQPEVTAETDRRHRSGLRIHRASLLPADRSLIDCIPVTSLTRTLLDLAAVVPSRLEEAMEKSEQRGQFDLSAVDELIARSRGRRGVARLRAAIGAYREPIFVRSEMERRFLARVRGADLPTPSINAFVEGHEVDALWPEERLVVELDGYEFHRTRRAHERDRRRDDDLALVGYDVVRLTWSRLGEPDLADRLVAHLTRRRRELGLK